MTSNQNCSMQECCLSHLFSKNSHGVERHKMRLPEKGAIFQWRAWSLRKEFTGGIWLNKACVDLLRPSLKEELFSVVWAERLRNVAGINISRILHTLFATYVYVKSNAVAIISNFYPKALHQIKKDNVGGVGWGGHLDYLWERLRAWK